MNVSITTLCPTYSLYWGVGLHIDSCITALCLMIVGHAYLWTTIYLHAQRKGQGAGHVFSSVLLLALLGNWEMETSTSMQETWPYVWVYIRVSYRGFPQKFENYDVVIATTRVYNTISNYRLNLLQLNPIIILSLKNVHHFIKNLHNLASFPDSPRTWTKNRQSMGGAWE